MSEVVVKTEFEDSDYMNLEEADDIRKKLKLDEMDFDNMIDLVSSSDEMEEIPEPKSKPSQPAEVPKSAESSSDQRAPGTSSQAEEVDTAFNPGPGTITVHLPPDNSEHRTILTEYRDGDTHVLEIEIIQGEQASP